MVITSIKKEKYIGKVYNIEVEEDNSYVCEDFIVHNCEEPVNQLSKFEVLWNPNRVTI